MKLKHILDSYHQELDERFGKNEVDAFFNLSIEHYLNLKRIRLVMEPDYVVSYAENEQLIDTLNLLKLKLPIQYILGETEFYGLPFKVTADTLIPRPETEELVDWIITDVNSNIDDTSLRLLDIGTGSGCIAISLAKHISNVKVSALDVSEVALNVAKHNAELNAVSVEFIHDTILNPSHKELVAIPHNYNIIVSNPPYVRNLEKAEIKPNVLDNEPHLALFVDDENPLQFYNAICEFAQLYLKDKGTLYLEINEYLGEEMIQLLKDFNFTNVELKKDIFGKDRMIKGVK